MGGFYMSVANSSEAQFLKSYNDAKQYQYGSNTDPVHNRITTMMREVMFSKATITYTKCDDIILKTNLTDLQRCSSAFNVAKKILNIKDQFPEVYEQNYQKDLEFIHKFLSEHGEELPFTSYAQAIQKTVKTDFAVVRFPDEYKGDILILGCGRAIAKDCLLHTDDKDSAYCINNAADADPDIVADYYSQDFWKVLPDAKFAKAYFEGFNPDACKESLKQIHRILKDHGVVRVLFSESFQAAYQYSSPYLEKYFLNCGFSKVKFETVLTRCCGVDSTCLVIDAYK